MFKTGRPERDQVLMSVALVIAARGTCSRLKVGAVASKGGRILVTGYNGAPAGLPHCDHREWAVGDGEIPRWVTPLVTDVDRVWFYDNGRVSSFAAEGFTADQHAGCDRAVHAEANLVAFAARHGASLEGSWTHLTHMPCLNCAMLLINAGVERVRYSRSYRKTDGVELLQAAGVDVASLDEE